MKKMKKKSISIVLAGYNEESLVRDSVLKVRSCFQNSGLDFEIILIDDGSKDKTKEEMFQLASTYDEIRAFSNDVNLNFGTSVLRGLLIAQNDYVIYNAFDLPLSPEDMVTLCSNIDDEDVIVLERLEYKTTKWRKITSNLNVALLKILFPRLTKGNPVLNYVQIFRRSQIESILPFARSPIFVWPELVFRAKVKGYKVTNEQVKCNIQEVRKGSFGHPHDIMWGMYEMFRFRCRLWRKNI